jgi:hypothetical protein
LETAHFRISCTWLFRVCDHQQRFLLSSRLAWTCLVSILADLRALEKRFICWTTQSLPDSTHDRLSVQHHKLPVPGYLISFPFRLFFWGCSKNIDYQRWKCALHGEFYCFSPTSDCICATETSVINSYSRAVGLNEIDFLMNQLPIVFSDLLAFWLRIMNLKHLLKNQRCVRKFALCDT